MGHTETYILTALLLAPLTLHAETPPQTIRETLVWTTGESGAEVPNIPGVCQSRSGTLLAFCEGRIRPGDADPHHLLLKCRIDQGATWSESLFVERNEHGECYGNPTPVVDRRTPSDPGPSAGRKPKVEKAHYC